MNTTTSNRTTGRFTLSGPKRPELTARQAEALRTLTQEPRGCATAATLAALMLTTPSGAGRLLRKLAYEGLVYPAIGKWWPTDEGRAEAKLLESATPSA
jgi:DNA-binding MarR family transcriptional regulator